MLILHSIWEGTESLTNSVTNAQCPKDMSSNLSVALAFGQQESAKSLNMESNGNVLFSYSTAIMQHAKIGRRKVLIVNRTKYSHTTSKQTTMCLNGLQKMPKKRYSKIIEVKGVPMGTYDLTRYAQAANKAA